jgi:hypothetical protein
LTGRRARLNHRCAQFDQEVGVGAASVLRRELDVVRLAAIPTRGCAQTPPSPTSRHTARGRCRACARDVCPMTRGTYVRGAAVHHAPPHSIARYPSHWHVQGRRLSSACARSAFGNVSRRLRNALNRLNQSRPPTLLGSQPHKCPLTGLSLLASKCPAAPLIANSLAALSIDRV